MAKGTGLTTTKYPISSELTVIVGKGPMTRPEIMKKVWVYIKKNGLQNENNKRMIVPDSRLSKVIGSKSIDMLKLAGKLSAHIG
jgi:chromatin remodeling complex protein RSC6